MAPLKLKPLKWGCPWRTSHNSCYGCRQLAFEVLGEDTASSWLAIGKFFDGERKSWDSVSFNRRACHNGTLSGAGMRLFSAQMPADFGSGKTVRTLTHLFDTEHFDDEFTSAIIPSRFFEDIHGGSCGHGTCDRNSTGAVCR